jgi:hypothetical protein
MNPYELMLGGPPSGEDQIRATAAKLRGADDRAILAMLSGDRVLAPVGAVQQRQTQSTAKGLAKAKQAAEELAARKQMEADSIKARREMQTEELAMRERMEKAQEARLAQSAAEQRAMMQAQYEQAAADRAAALEATKSYNESRIKIEEGKLLDRETKEQAKLDKYNQDEARKLAFKLTDEGVTDLESSIDIADKVVMNYFDPNTGVRKSNDIPGYGAATSILPNVALSAEGKQLRGVLASVRNKILKARSGAAVTDPEMMRLAEELGTAMGQTEEEMIQAYVNVKKALSHVKGGIMAGFAPEVVENYESRLGANAPRYSLPQSAPNRTSRGTTYEVVEE